MDGTVSLAPGMDEERPAPYAVSFTQMAMLFIDNGLVYRVTQRKISKNQDVITTGEHEQASPYCSTFNIHNYHIRADMDSPTGRMIRIGKSAIGLIGVDIALNKALAAEMGVNQAVDFIFQAVKEQNYIPPTMVEKYREAIGREYRKMLGIDDDHEQGLTAPTIPGSHGIRTSLSVTIRILGTGCVSCNGLYTMVINAMERAGVAADIEQIHDPDEISRLGVTITPALMINGRVKIAGIQPTLAQVEGWIREVAPAPSMAPATLSHPSPAVSSDHE